jgi:hypothetical protein
MNIIAKGLRKSKGNGVELYGEDTGGNRRERRGYGWKCKYRGRRVRSCNTIFGVEKGWNEGTLVLKQLASCILKPCGRFVLDCNSLVEDGCFTTDTKREIQRSVIRSYRSEVRDRVQGKNREGRERAWMLACRSLGAGRDKRGLPFERAS